LRESHNSWHVVAVKNFLTERLDLRLQPLTIALCNEHRDELVASLADLAPGFVHAYLDAEMLKGAPPSLGVQGVAVHQSSVNIAQQHFSHATSDAGASN
jgi:hypothetical protein